MADNTNNFPPHNGAGILGSGILLLIVGVQFFSMGLIGELITKTAHRNKSIVLRKYKKQ